MTYTGRHHARVFVMGLALVLASALAPAGVHGESVPGWAWVVWGAVFVAALVCFQWAGLIVPEALRRVSWLMPAVLLLTVPAALLAPAGSRVLVAAALCGRATAAASMAAAMATWLGPAGLVRAVRQLHVPVRLADVFEATLSSLTVVLRQVTSMLRAREARRPGFGAWSAVLHDPIDTVRGFGRLVASLLLRSLERAEATEQARRARGGVS
ncbi:MAG: energy-coupling factor transporter transmembrane component T [Acidobacteria bacterium]|nr:energy-coupling factor transporter transmembrane component T [Acidobacteriota bacterium]